MKYDIFHHCLSEPSPRIYPTDVLLNSSPGYSGLAKNTTKIKRKLKENTQNWSSRYQVLTNFDITVDYANNKRKSKEPSNIPNKMADIGSPTVPTCIRTMGRPYADITMPDVKKTQSSCSALLVAPMLSELASRLLINIGIGHRI